MVTILSATNLCKKNGKHCPYYENKPSVVWVFSNYKKALEIKEDIEKLYKVDIPIHSYEEGVPICLQ